MEDCRTQSRQSHMVALQGTHADSRGMTADCLHIKPRKETLMYPVIIHDPYRNCDTTYGAFAKAEGCPRMAVYLYHRRHGNLEGFRDRPLKGNGIKPHTYRRNGEYISIPEAVKATGLSVDTLSKYSRLGIVDVEEIISTQQRKREARTRVITSDSGPVSPSEYARTMGVTANTVYQYIKHHGDITGFETRGPSRVNPKRYPHSGLGVSKTLNEWAEHFKCSRSYIKTWIHAHGGTMDGFEERNAGARRPVRVYHNGRQATLREWADILGVPYKKVKTYYNHHRTLEGFGVVKRGRPRKCAA